MKKLLSIILFISFISCSDGFKSRKNLNPDEVFKKWRFYASQRKYSRMLKYEYFKFFNIISIYNRLNNDKKWNDLSNKEQDNFIEKYKKELITLLDEKNDDRYFALLRLKKEYKIKIITYNIDLIKDKAVLWFAADYPGSEKIKLVKINGCWYLINPLGYHNYTSVYKKFKKLKTSGK